MAPGGGAAVFGGDANPMAEAPGARRQAKRIRWRPTSRGSPRAKQAMRVPRSTSSRQRRRTAAGRGSGRPADTAQGEPDGKAAGSAAVKGDGPLDGLGRYIRLDGIQRVESCC